MSLIAEFTMRSPELVLSRTLGEVPEASVELEQQMAATAGTPVLIVWVTGDVFTAFDDALDRDRTVESHAIVEDFGSRKLYRLHLVRENLQPVYPTYQELGAVPLAGEAVNGIWWRRVRYPDRKALVEFRTFCSEIDIEFTLERLYAPSSPTGRPKPNITNAQREALAIAYERGYFNVPRDATLAELGETLDVSKQSVSERLRRAQTRLVEAMVLDDPI